MFDVYTIIEALRAGDRVEIQLDGTEEWLRVLDGGPLEEDGAVEVDLYGEQVALQLRPSDKIRIVPITDTP
jgi:hypothetical protein